VFDPPSPSRATKGMSQCSPVYDTDVGNAAHRHIARPTIKLPQRETSGGYTPLRRHPREAIYATPVPIDHAPSPVAGSLYVSPTPLPPSALAAIYISPTPLPPSALAATYVSPTPLPLSGGNSQPVTPVYEVPVDMVEPPLYAAPPQYN